MDIRQLKIFQSVAKHKSFTLAAKEIRIAQPAVSIAIRKLEEELELKLFNRSDKKVLITAEGEVLLKHAKKLSAQVEDTLSHMNDLRELKTGEVKIGMPAMMGTYFFPSIFSQFMEAYPMLNIQVYDEGTQTIRRRLLSGEIELGVVTIGDAISELKVLPFLQQEMLVCVRADHPLADRSSIDFLEFAREKLIMVRDGYFLRETINRLSKRYQIKPKVIFETNLMALTRSLVTQGNGIGICMKMMLRDETELKGLSFDPPVMLEFALAWKKNGYLSKANQVFSDFLLNNSWEHLK